MSAAFPAMPGTGGGGCARRAFVVTLPRGYTMMAASSASAAVNSATTLLCGPLSG